VVRRDLPVVLALGAGSALAAPSAALASGDELAPSQLSRAWEFPPTIVVCAVVALALFVRAFVRLRRRGRADHAGWGRLALFVAAIAASILPLVSPLDAAGDGYLISAHMLQHVLIGDVAPALALAALRGPLLFFFVPAEIVRLATHRPRMRRTLHTISRPDVSFVLWACTIAAWHVPPAYDYALSHPFVHQTEHLTFVAAGTLVWMQLVDPARRHALSREQRLEYAAGIFFCGLVLSAVLMLSAGPLYPAYADQQFRLFGWSALRDQQLAGGVMLVEQSLALGACAFMLTRGVTRRAVYSAATSRRRKTRYAAKTGSAV
jgi:putative membrane protein